MKYERPGITLEKYTLSEPVMAGAASSIDPTQPTDPTKPGPVIEPNDPLQELGDAFGDVLDLSKK